MHFLHPSKLHCFQLIVNPRIVVVVLCFLIDEGYYQGGKFQFETEVPDAYNMVVSSLRLSHVPPSRGGWLSWGLVVPSPASCPHAAHPVLGLSMEWPALVRLMPLTSSI